MMNKLMIMAMVIGFFIVGMEICTLKADEVALEKTPVVQIGLSKKSRKLREKKLREGLKNGFINRMYRPAHLGETANLKDGLKNGLKDGLKVGKKNRLNNGLKNGLNDGLKNGLRQGLQQGMLRKMANGLRNGLKNGPKRNLKE